MVKKKLVSFLLTGTVLFSGVSQVSAGERIGLKINDKKINTISAPVVVNNRTLVPARAVLEALGAKVTWEQNTKKIYADMENINIVFQIDNDTALVNNKEVSMEVGPKIINNATMIPVRFAAEILGYDVQWNSEENCVIMKSSENKTPQSAKSETIIVEKPIQNIEKEAVEEIEIKVDVLEKNEDLKSSPLDYKEVSYDFEKDTLILEKNSVEVDINSFVCTDEYFNNKYIINLNADYSNLYKDNTYKINNEKIDSIEIITIDNKTKIVFNEKDIYAYKINEYEEHIAIEILKPKEFYEHIVVIDAGHGGKDPGNVNNNVVEKTVNLNVSEKVRQMLENNSNIKVYVTRTGDTYPSFTDRVELGNKLADMFVSIHCNAMANNSSIKGVQVFYPNPTDQRGKISMSIAEIFKQTMTENTGLSKKSADQTLGYSLYVLRKTTVPACLIELGFLTNTYDAGILCSEQGVNLVAEAIYKGIKMSMDEILN